MRLPLALAKRGQVTLSRLIRMRDRARVVNHYRRVYLPNGRSMTTRRRAHCDAATYFGSREITRLDRSDRRKLHGMHAVCP